MVLERAVVSASTSLNNLIIIPRNPNTKPKSAFIIQFSNRFPASLFKKLSRTTSNGCLKCSMDDFRNNSYNQVTYPRPSEIPWKKELCNSVNLIGIVAAPIEIKHLPSGKVVGWTRLAVKTSPAQTTWINLTFWEELANVAFQHLEKGHKIYVSGRLISDTVESDDGKQQTYYKVVVQQLNFIDRSLLPVSSYDYESNSMTAGSVRKGGYVANNTASTEQLWQAFFANPMEWWDNRKNKRNPKYPDFKHKDTGEALWVEGRSNPQWVKSQLAILDMRMGSFADQNDRMPTSMVAGDEFLSF
ncbi:hypothetical protein L6164_034477 [Bauhinia variegata]|uniref:Uncharacterized protein n=1 Tax=Bauhinia variegata TaxID=167791 RepID=A0ACB9KVK4_BAUVA|nr:hypothetical protein L6164_034477 [Bauhinia variegata]